MQCEKKGETGERKYEKQHTYEASTQTFPEKASENRLHNSSLFSGIRLNDIVQMATEKENIEPDYRIRTIESLSRHIESALRYTLTSSRYTPVDAAAPHPCWSYRPYRV